MSIKILDEAAAIAQKAAAEQFAKLQAAGPRFSIRQADLSGKIIGPSMGTMLDNCGGAWIVISGKEYTTELKGCNTRYEDSNWSIRKGIYKGYHISLHYPLHCRQEVSIHEAANQAAVDFLKQNGYECYMYSYID